MMDRGHMMDHDEMAERYLDKTFPETRQDNPTDRDLELRGEDVPIWRRAEQIVRDLQGRLGRLPTMDEIRAEAQTNADLERRRGL